jgi:hypothetical protein
VARIEQSAFGAEQGGSTARRRLGLAVAVAACLLAVLWWLPIGQPLRDAVMKRAAPVVAPSQQQSMELWDDARQDDGLRAFLQRLNGIVKARDSEALLKVTDDNVKVRVLPQTVAGKTALVTAWGLDRDPGGSGIWEVLSQLLVSGGRSQDGHYTMPGGYYTAGSAFQADSRHTFLISLVAGSNLVLYGEPNLSAQDRVALDDEEVVQEWLGGDEVLPVAEGGRTYRWVRVSTMSGKSGYVLSKYVHSDANYRLRVARGADGSWRIVLLADVNGDS